MTKTQLEERAIPAGRQDDAIVTRWILVGLVLTILPVFWVLVLGMPEGGAGMPHPTIEKMDVGAPPASRIQAVFEHGPFLTLLFGLMMVNGLIFLGIAQRLRTLAVRILLGAVFFLQAGVMATYWFSYVTASEAGWSSLLLGFPFPTAVLLFVFYPSLCLYCILYIVRFRALVLPHDHQVAFDQLVEEMKDIPEDQR